MRFDDLTIRQKSSLLFQHGKYLMTFSFNMGTVNLYALENEFIEVYSNNPRGDVYKITVASYADLDKYLPFITIDNDRNLHIEQ